MTGQSVAAAQSGSALSVEPIADVGSHLSSVWKTSKVFVERELGEITKQYFWMTEDEIRTGLDLLEGSESLFALKVRQHRWVQLIRRMIAEKAMHDADAAGAGETKTAVNELAERANQALLARRRHKKGKQSEGKRCGFGRLRLDDAVRQAKENGDPNKAFDGWSEARVKAFKQSQSNQNAYYYRFNTDGEEQDRGPWRPEEKELFLKRLKEMGPTQQWGLFSIAIPRRVGYQCSNFYRKLLMDGEVTDPNYVIDKDGKLRYLFANVKVGKDGVVTKSGRSSSSSSKRAKSGDADVVGKNERGDGDDGEGDSHCAKKPRAKGLKKGCKDKSKKKKKKKSIWESDTDDDDDESDVEDYGRSSMPVGPSVIRTRSGRGGGLEAENPAAETEFGCMFLNYIDPITRAPVKKPAISKYGHVMGYDTWMKCFNASRPDQGARCPLTNQKLSKSDITLLTPENIHCFRDKIIHLA